MNPNIGLHSATDGQTPRVALLAHEQFPGNAKTAVGILRYAEYEVVGVLDRSNSGRRVTDFLTGVQDAPIVSRMQDVPECDALIIGIAPIGGGLADSWRPDIRSAIERGCSVISGLHEFLRDDAEFVDLAGIHDADLRDVRQPPSDLTVASGSNPAGDATVVLTVGSDCSTGKMTTAIELARAARDRGLDAAFVPTGQTGILIEGWGIAIDRVIADFAAGAVESLIRERAGHEYLFVEGQGSLIHPAYSGVTCSILHGSMPDALVLCHVAGREALHGYSDTPIPSLAKLSDLYEELAAPVYGSSVVGGSLATHHISDDETAREAIESCRQAIDAPVMDPIRFGVTDVLEAIT